VTLFKEVSYGTTVERPTLSSFVDNDDSDNGDGDDDCDGIEFRLEMTSQVA